jgi:RND superfamily putative drug exporter
VVGTLLVLWCLTALTPVSLFALNLTTALGLGLAIDYSLFMVNRFREELRAGADVDDAVLQTVRTAGRTVVYSAATVALSLSALLVFPLYFLRSFAYAGIAVVALAALAAVLVLPAALALLGHWVDRLTLIRRRVPGRQVQHQRTFWEVLALAVMRWPVPVALATVVLLGVLGAPFLDVRFGNTDDRGLPTSAASRQASDAVRAGFDAFDTETLSVVSATRLDDTRLDAYAAALSRLPGAARVESGLGTYQGGVRIAPPQEDGRATATGTWLSVAPAVAANTEASERLVHDVRAVPGSARVRVGGPAAGLADARSAGAARRPVAMTIVAVAVGVLLFLFTGSVLVPVKALLLNLLSLSATFGSMVLIFQKGHLRWLFGDFTVTGTLDITMPILMFCVAFGLSMDYEVFLLSRIREEWVATADNTTAVARGIGHTGRLITSAAVLISVVFLSLAISAVTSLKMLGVGLALAVLVDATIVRGALVPAFMRLAGRANWWAPPVLRAMHDRFGLREEPATATTADRGAMAGDEFVACLK